MTPTQEFTKAMQDMFKNMPMDGTSAQDAVKTTADLGQKMSKLALDAAGKSADISTKWTSDTIAKLGEATADNADANDYAASLNQFASACTEMATQNIAAFAEIAKKMQMDTVELLMAAGQSTANAADKKAKPGSK